MFHYEDDFRNLLRLCKSESIPVDLVQRFLKLVEKITTDVATSGTERDIRFAKIKFVEEQRVFLEFTLERLPYLRCSSENEKHEHEFVLRVKPQSLDRFYAIVPVVGKILFLLDTWYPELKHSMKVQLVTGQVIEGCFSDAETLQDVKQWVISYLRSTVDFNLATTDIPSRVLVDLQHHTAHEFARQKLICKHLHEVERVEATNHAKKAQDAMEQSKRQAEFEKKRQEKETAKLLEEQKRQHTISQFEQDRIAAVTKSQRAIAKVAKKQ